ncbi:MAG TPA: MFS transporter [Clostridia bacterium]
MRSYLKSLKNLPFGVKYFFLIQIIMGIGTGIWNFNINYYLESRGFGTSEIGRIVAVGSVTTALFSILSGYLCDRYGYKKNIITGCLLKTAAMFSVYFLVPENTVYIILFINGIGDSMILTSSYPYITSMVGDEEKSTAYTLLFSCTMFSFFLGNTSGGFLLTLWSKASRYENSILVSAVLVGTALLMLRLLPGTTANRNIGIKIYIPGQRSVLSYLFFDFMGYAGYFLSYSMLNLICRDFIGIPEHKTGLVLGALSVMSSIAVFLVPPAASKFGRVKLGMVILVVLTGLYILMSFMGGYVFIIFAILTALLSNMIPGVVDGPMLNRIPEGEKGGFSGLRVLVNNMGTSLGITAAGSLLSVDNGIAIIYLITAFLLLMQVLVFAFGFMNYIE